MDDPACRVEFGTTGKTGATGAAGMCCVIFSERSHQITPDYDKCNFGVSLLVQTG